MRPDIYHITLIILLMFLAPVMYSQEKKNILDIDPEDVISTYERSMLLGTNAGIYYEESYFMDLDLLDHLRDLRPGIIRIPGGSWSNELYWNGNRVRISEESYIAKETWDSTVSRGGNPIAIAFDTGRYEKGLWEVDYSGYSPGFRIRDINHNLSDFHGFTDVLFLHKFIQALGAKTMVTVNVGTGTVDMAVEWVKWTREREKYLRKPFDVNYWEMGNELDGEWELGHFMPDGRKMDAVEYVRRYTLFAKAMKQADPTIKVGGSVASSMKLAFIEELIRDTAAPIDFISFHAYPSHNDDEDFVKMMGHAIEVNTAVARIKAWLEEYRPREADNIEIAVTEWNIKVKEDYTTLGILNALWSSVMIGEMAKAGVDVAIQWDLFSTTDEGGHGLFSPRDLGMIPRSQYWACYLWSHYMGDRMVRSTLTAPGFVRAYSTLGDEYLSIMVINGSETETVDIEMQLPALGHLGQGQEIVFSGEQYKMNFSTRVPEKSIKPLEKDISLQEVLKVTVDPYSIKVIRYPHAYHIENNMKN